MNQDKSDQEGSSEKKGRPLGCVVSLIAAVLLLVGASLIIGLLAAKKPKAVIAAPEKIMPTVEVVSVKIGEEVIQVSSQGELEPGVSTTLAAEVGGKVISVSPRLEVGETFAKGEVLLEIDPADFTAQVAMAASTLADARLGLSQEEAKAQQAVRDWKKLGGGKEASDLVLRKPQLVSAKARVDAAAASWEKAKRDLERTKITAPYDARIRAKSVELGSFVAPGAPVASVYSTGDLEVRLPVTTNDVPYIDPSEAPSVSLSAEMGGEEVTWEGKIVRSEGEIDRVSRSVYLVAQLPAGTVSEGGKAAVPGLFVRAEVAGRKVEGLVRLPRRAFQGADQVVVVSPENKLQLRQVEVLRADGRDVLISSGLDAGERVCVTALDSVVEGMEVNILTETEDPPAVAEPAVQPAT